MPERYLAAVGVDLLLKDLQLTWIIDHEVLLVTTPEEAENRLTTKVLDVADLVVCRDSKGKLWNDYDSLIDAIKSTVMPTTWDDVGGPGSVAPADFGTAKALIVHQTQRVHGAIADMLADLRAVAKKTPDVGPPVRDKTEPVIGDRAGPMPSCGSSPKQGTKGGTHGDKGNPKKVLDKPTSAPTPPLRPIQGGLMVDKKNIIWDHGKPVGIWGVDGSEM